MSFSAGNRNFCLTVQRLMIRDSVNVNALYDDRTIRDALASFREKTERANGRETEETRFSYSGVNGAGTRHRGTERAGQSASFTTLKVYRRWREELAPYFANSVEPRCSMYPKYFWRVLELGRARCKAYYTQ